MNARFANNQIFITVIPVHFVDELSMTGLRIMPCRSIFLRSARTYPLKAPRLILLECGEATVDPVYFNIRLKAQYRGANLIVIAGVEATIRAPRSVIPFLTGERLRSGQVFGLAAVFPGISDVGTDIDSGPGEYWKRRYRLPGSPRSAAPARLKCMSARTTAAAVQGTQELVHSATAYGESGSESSSSRTACWIVRQCVPNTSMQRSWLMVT